jgi:hypothetical protein
METEKLQSWMLLTSEEFSREKMVGWTLNSGHAMRAIFPREIYNILQHYHYIISIFTSSV